MMRNTSIALLVGAALVMGVVLTACLDDGTDAPTDDFVISNLGVTFDAWDRASNTAGDFVFLERERKVFLEFGAIVSDGEGGTKELPTFEYRIDPEAVVLAIAEGTVTRFAFQEDTEDYEFAVRSDRDPAFEVGYDHVLNPTVSLGDSVEAGDILGNPGTWSEQLGRFEIMINNSETDLSYCPFTFFDPNLAQEYQQQVSRFMADWEAFKGDSTVYDEESHVCPGCRYESMVTY
jgi:hypothetical protein